MTWTPADEARHRFLTNKREVLRLESVQRNKIATYFPDKGPYRRELYPKHMEFFAASAKYREISLIAANRVGKSEAGAYAAALHLTGDYPDWWVGKRFDHAVRGWAAGTTNEKTKEIVQEKLCGCLEREANDDPQKAVGLGTGMIPGDKIASVEYHPGIRNSIKTVWVEHRSGRKSQLTFKSFEQGREAFEGTQQDFVWLDELAPEDVYLECLVRTMTTNGIVYLTFTPLNGLTEVVLLFMPGGDVPAVQDKGRYVVQAEWDDVPHLSEEAKAELYRSIPPHQRDARSKGRPQLGSGAIFPVPETDISVQPFDIPRHWPRAYGLDVGTCTACVWGAIDPESGCIYLYREYYREGEEPAVHAAAIKGAGAWIPGVIDPAARGRSQIDGRALLDMYRDLGLDIETATHYGRSPVETGLLEMWDAMTAGKFKVFSSLTRWFQEFRLYRRDDKGRIVKKFDHLVDGSRYLFLAGRDRAKAQPGPPKVYAESAAFKGDRGWMV
jgi:phage terminase large subunit-like protein